MTANEVQGPERSRRLLVLAGAVTVAAALAVSGTAFALAARSSAPRAVSPPAAWTRAPAPAGTRHDALHGVSCAGAACLAIGAYCASPTCPGVTPQVTLASRTLGDTWTRATSPASFEIAFAGVACASASFCALGGTSDPGSPSPSAALAITHNLGASWTTTPVTGLGILIASTCASTAVCYATGIASPPVSQTAYGQIATTRNAGGHWTVATFPLTGDVDGITCSTPSRCTAFGTSTDGGHTVLLRTTNAGASWASRALPERLGVFRWLTCPGPSECVGVSTRPLGAPSSIDTTHDGGASWSHRAIGPKDVLFGAACESAVSCTFVGQSVHQPLTAVTANGGASWTFAPELRLGSGRLWSITCARTRHCVSVGERWTSAPSDGGPLLVHRDDGPRARG